MVAIGKTELVRRVTLTSRRILTDSMIEEGMTVDDLDAFPTVRVVAQRTGLLVGRTARGAIYMTLKLLPLTQPASTMAFLPCDDGEKYLDKIYDDGCSMKRQLLGEAAHRRVHPLFDAYRGSGDRHSDNDTLRLSAKLGR